MRAMLVFIAIILVSPVLIAAPVLNDAQLCQAAIATNNGHSARAVKVLSSQDGIVEVSYLRLSDRKHFKFWCKIEPTEIRWKDEYIGRWSQNLRVYYKTLDKKTIEIRSVSVGEENYPDIKSFSHKDFK